MQALSFGDWISVEVFFEKGEDILKSNDPSLAVDDTNLIMKALKLFKDVTNLKSFHAHITLDKHIPKMAGLGGGSSNAATTLWALNSLLKTKITHSKLKSMGAILGSDVPFFFSEGIAKCSGRGEVISGANKSHLNEFWLVKPKHINLSTPLVYKHCIPNVFSKKTPGSFFKSFNSNKPNFINELEFPVFKLVPKLKTFKEKLMDYGFTNVMMTGSGSAFIAFGNSQKLPSSIWKQKVVPIFRSSDSWYKEESTLS